MKRILSFVIVLSFLFSGIALAWQDNYDYVTRLDFKTYVSDNTTGIYKVTDVSTSTIVPGSYHILGYSIMPLSVNSENVCSLYDGTGDANFIDETECPANSYAGKWFTYPKSVKTQLTIRQGAQTRVMVYYSII